MQVRQMWFSLWSRLWMPPVSESV